MDRKQFLRIMGRSALFAAAAPALDRLGEAVAPVPRWEAAEHALLSTFADEIIPAADGMPAASEIGVARYIERVAGEDAGIAAPLREALAAIAHRAAEASAETFDLLPAPARVALLQAMEKDDPDRFRTARDLVYEAYYTNPLVWKRLGYDFIEGNASGSPLEPFEEALLQRVRSLPRLYRVVP